MKIRRDKQDEQPIVLEQIEPFFLDLLWSLPQSADTRENPAARARLFSAPMSPGGDGDEFNEDWERYVEPEIQALFRSTQEVVTEDLAKLPPREARPATEAMADPQAFAPTQHELEIPHQHFEAWLSVLNQARISIAAKRGFGEREMGEGLPMPPFSERDMDLFRIHFFEFIQQVLLSELGFD